MLETGQVHNIWRHSFRCKEIAVKGRLSPKGSANLESDH